MLEATTLRVQTVTLCTEPCQVGEFCVAGVSVGVRCPLMHSTTKGRGAASEEDCVCRASYFNDGGSYEPCEAAGTNCTEEGVSISTLPLLPDWWRLPNSTQLQRCFPISNCTGGTNASALCGEGYESDLLYPTATLCIHPATLCIQPVTPYTQVRGGLLWCLLQGSQRHALPPLRGAAQPAERGLFCSATARQPGLLGRNRRARSCSPHSN